VCCGHSVTLVVVQFAKVGRSRWFSRQALLLHVVLLVTVPTFFALCDWQVHRALSGNSLSWAYVFEWPFFAAYAIYLWWRLLHEQMGVRSDPPQSSDKSLQDKSLQDKSLDGESLNSESLETELEDQELAAYNRYLAELNSSGREKRW